MADTVAASFAVAAVAAAIGRYAVVVGVSGSRAVARRLPLVGTEPTVRPGGRLATVVHLFDRPRSAAERVVGRVADRVVPRAAREIFSRLDVPALVRDYVDIDAIVAQVDLDRAVERVDIAAVIDRVDLDAVVAKVDLDQAVERVDIDRILDRTDISGIARYVIQEIDLPGLIRYSTGSVTTEMVHGVRGQSVDADRAVERVVDRLLMRRQSRRAMPPPAEVPEPRPAPEEAPRP